MRLYVGSRDYKPEGYQTVDIDPGQCPDFVADATNMELFSSGACDEILASHILEHISWPDSFKALAEFSRILKPGGILKVAVPDVVALLQNIKSGASEFWAMGLIYGVGGRENSLEVHRYGFTEKMLVDILEVLGFSSFSWWNSPAPDASNGWMPTVEMGKSSISLNIQAVKSGPPRVPVDRLYQELLQSPLQSFRLAVAQVVGQEGHAVLGHGPSQESVYQDIHFKLVEANQRIRYLEGLISQSASHDPSDKNTTAVENP